MSSQFQIAVLQKRAKSRDIQENAKQALLEMEKAKEMGADLLLFPECYLTDYRLPISREEALSPEDEIWQVFCEKAKALSMGVAITSFTKGKERARNSAFVIDKEGRLLMKYDKVHTCDFADESCLEGGEDFFVCDFHGVKLGVMICYDREYPESARVLMLKGAEIILVPNDCGGMKNRLNTLSTRAYENMTGVVMANPPGENAGCSCAFSPIVWDEDGNCLDMTMFVGGEKEEAIYLASYDLEELRAYRSSEMMGNTFRKPHAYEMLLTTEIREPFLREGQR